VSILDTVPSYRIPQQALDLLGCADTLVERGIKLSTMNYYDRSDNYLLGVDFNGLIGKTHLPFCILIPQHMTEATLTQKLKDVGVSAFRPYNAVGMHENSKDSSLVDVSFENGQSITARYVIGADGPRSTVHGFILFVNDSLVLTVTVRYANYQA
jgi:2-polyprenyl-6-methoxyphenol hydroxylase-like FAD-dependent oxidoreductase